MKTSDCRGIQLRTPREWVEELYRRRHDGHTLGLCPECMEEALESFARYAEAEVAKAQHLLEGARLLYKQMDRIAFPPSDHPDAAMTAWEIRGVARQALRSPVAYRFIEDCLRKDVTGQRPFDHNDVGGNLST